MCLTDTTETDGSFLIEGLSANTYVVDNLGAGCANGPFDFNAVRTNTSSATPLGTPFCHGDGTMLTFWAKMAA